MRILIVDDNIEKISELSELIYSKIPNAYIETSQNITSAMLLFKESDCYNLAVIDLLLPIRANEIPIKEGGKILLDDLYRKSNLNIPNYIIGFTQSDDKDVEFSSIWNVIYCDKIGKWRKVFNDLLTHISNTKFINLNDAKNLPTLYVEGVTDDYYIKSAIEIFYGEYLNKLEVISQKNAGANWIANQITIWALKLNKAENQEYLKAVGLLDSDDAGNKAKRVIENKNLTDNQKKCFNIIQISPSHNPKILNFYQNKCKIEIEIESLFSFDILKYADSCGWLEFRSVTFIETPLDWEQFNQSARDYVLSKGILEDDLLYLKKVKKEHKKDFSDYVNSLENKEEVFSNFKTLVEQILTTLKLLK